MNITEYTQLMNKPNAVSELQIGWKSIGWVPYFQSARLRLRDFITKSFKYNFALKVTAAQPTEFCLISLLLIHLMPFKTLKKKKQVTYYCNDSRNQYSKEIETPPLHLSDRSFL
jgi:hypothetical protein